YFMGDGMDPAASKTEKRSFWKDLGETVVYFLFLIPATLVRILSLKKAYFLARTAAFFLYCLDGKHRKRIITHLLHSGIVSTKKEARRLAKKNFVHMAKVFVEVVKFDQIVTKENHREYLIADPDFSQDHLYTIDPATSVPVILASMHLGNWELAANCYSYYTNQTICSIMRPLANKKIGDYFYRKRSGTAHETVSKDKGIKPLLSALRAGKTIAIVADQHASHTEGVELKFFGHPARTHMTPALLHLKTAVPIFPAVLIRLDDDFHFLITGGKLIRYTPTGDKEKDIRAVTEAFSASFEKLVRKYPDQWLWAHRRWLDCNRGGSWSPDHFESMRVNKTGETPPNASPPLSTR
ncbi:MAG: lysophospholipid acyltransferase family protein, partial [Lentisphaeria bacterium]|nr:lysophospholipid acyltransferase family protein [Lentisphaeria bacterium]